MSKNPFTKVTSSADRKFDVNLRSVRSFRDNGNGTTRLTYFDGSFDDIKEGPTTIRNRTKKVWPDHTTTTDVVIDNGAEG